MKAIKFLIFIFFFITVAQARANISLEATVDKTEATMEDVFQLQVSVSGIQGAPEPELPSLPGFQIQSQGSSSSFQIMNGQINSSSTFSYALFPKKTGEFIVSPIILRHKGQVYQSRPFKLKVLGAAVGGAMPENDNAFIITDVSNPKPYVNEQITYTFQFLRKVQVANPQLQLPGFNQFLKEELGKQRDYQKVINGQAYLVTEIKFALFPNVSGKKVIDPATLQVSVLQTASRSRRNDPFFNDPFFGGNMIAQQKNLQSKPIEIEVLPLPQNGKPANYKNIVGSFTLTTEISKKELKKGETTTLTITIIGDGNVNDINLPEENNNDFKTYEDKPEFIKNPQENRLTGTKVLKRSLVPLKTGEIKIAPIEIPYFNPKTKKYELLKTEPISLNVLPSTEDEKLSLTTSQTNKTLGTKVKVLAKDLFDIHSDLKAFTDQKISRKQLNTFYVLLLFPIFMFGFIFYYINRQRRLKNDVGYARSSTAGKKAYKKIKALKTPNGKDFYTEISKILKEYIGDKFNLQGSAFTAIDVEQKLAEIKFPAELIQQIKALLEKCEMAQYTQNFSFNDNPENLSESVKQMISQMEKIL